MTIPEEQFTPRAYQVDLYEKALLGNSILYLPTGAGKTYVVVMVIKRLSGAIRKPWGEGGKRTFMLVNTVPLVEQQCAYVARHTDLSCSSYSGDMNVDTWNQDQWNEELKNNQVLVMTSQILLDILNHGFVNLAQINLLIFDECHHAVGDHPMRLIMKRFEDVDVKDHPKIIGTSATLLNSNVKTESVLNSVRDLEVTFHATVITVDSMAPVQGYGRPNERCMEYLPLKKSKVADSCEKILDTANALLSMVSIEDANPYAESSLVFRPRSKSAKLKCVFEDIREHLTTQGLYVAGQAALYHMVQLEKIKRSLDDHQSLNVISSLITSIIKIRVLIERVMKGLSEIQKLSRFTCDQLQKLFSVLKEYHNQQTIDNEKFCCIIFVRRRFTAKILYSVLKNLATNHSDFKFLVPEYVIGSSGDALKSPSEAICFKKWTSEALAKFRMGSVNCIIATDVLDEGVDIPACSLVIRYEMPQDFRAYVQSKGRCRHKNSTYVMFYCATDDSFQNRYRAYQNVEMALSQQLVGKTDSRMEPDTEELELGLYACEIPPYSVKDPNGVISVVTEASAVGLVNHYCSTLIQSKFVHCVPTYILEKIPSADGKLSYQVSLRMPIVSPLRDIIKGDKMASISSAKRSAAIKVCKKLHEIGELTDRLLPKTKTELIDDISMILENWQEEADSNKKSVGTSGTKRPHDIVYPEQFYAAFPQPDKTSYLHVITMKPLYAPPTENRNKQIYLMLSRSAGYAILSSKELPTLPDIPIYMNVGDLKVTIKNNHAKLLLSNAEIQELRNFHWVVFNEVLHLIKNFMIYDKDNLDNSFMVVPATDNFQIDWDVVRNNRKVNEISTPFFSQNAITASEETEHIPEEPLCEWDLVTPNYRSSTNMYVVTQVCDDMKPGSAFPTDDYDTYQQYFWDRHSIKIVQANQPLLEVKPISQKINCIKPRGMSKSASKRKRDDLEEHLIPELCSKITFPALYWLKATVLPSIIHRIHQLLIAEDFRRKIVLESGLGSLTKKIDNMAIFELFKQQEIDTDETPEQLQFDTTLDDSMTSENVTSNLTPSSPGVDIFSLATNKYPWPEENEPCDIERNFDNVQCIDIDYYCKFTKSISYMNLSTKKENFHRQYLNKSNVLAPTLIMLTKSVDSDGPSVVEIMTALTAKFAHDAFNFERLETLGDSFLKFISSLFLFEEYTLRSEGHLTTFKGTIIGNRHLYYCGIKKDLAGRLKVDNFEALSNFIVPSYCAPREIQKIVKTEKKAPNVLYEVPVPKSEQFDGQLSSATMTNFREKIIPWIEATIPTGVEHFTGIQVLPDKTVSDAVEALTGVYLNSMGPIGAAKLLQWFGVLPGSMCIQDVLNRKSPTAAIGDGDVSLHMPWANFIEKKVGYKFKDRSFLLQAFTHSSYTPNTVTMNYDRLEFLGDAIIDFLITTYIYENCGDLTPGALTDLRSALVNNITFACLTVKYGLHIALLAYAPKLSDAIDRFVKYQEERNYAVNDELLWVLLEEDECNMAEYVDVPKVLGDLFESVIGAIYLDTGKDLKIVWQILYSLMHNEIQSFSKNVPMQPVRVIHETPGVSPKFWAAETVEGINSIMVPLEVHISGKKKLFHGFGATKRQAKAAAAKQALKSLRHKII